MCGNLSLHSFIDRYSVLLSPVVAINYKHLYSNCRVPILVFSLVCPEFKDSWYILDISTFKSAFEEQILIFKVDVPYQIIFHTDYEKVLIIHITEKYLITEYMVEGFKMSHPKICLCSMQIVLS